MSDAELAQERRLAHERADISAPMAVVGANGRGASHAKTALAWLAVGLPLIWGIWVTLEKALILFR
jgi:hypothetical protein